MYIFQNKRHIKYIFTVKSFLNIVSKKNLIDITFICEQNRTRVNGRKDRRVSAHFTEKENSCFWDTTLESTNQHSR